MRNRTLLSKGKMKLLRSGNSMCRIFQGRHQDVQWNLQNWYHYSLLGHTTALDDKKRQYPWQLLTSLDTHTQLQMEKKVSSSLINAPGDTEAILFQGYGSFHPCWSIPVWQLATQGTQYSNPTITHRTGDRIQIKVTSFPHAKAILYFPVQANSATINKDKP